MNTITMDLSILLGPFENTWVALAPNYRKVIASGETLDEVESELDGEQLNRLVFFKVPRFDAVFRELDQHPNIGRFV
jgi:hypothetical protein